MPAPLETIAYLARSEHRIEVLDAIRNEPRTREEIRALTDASRVTTGRLIADLEERDWIVRTGQVYKATTTGSYLAREFTRLLENVDTMEALPPVLEWLPDDEPTFDLRALEDARVTAATEGDLLGPIHRSLELIEGADEVTAIANGASREFTQAIRAAVESGATHTLMLPADAVAALRSDPELRADGRAMLDTGRATLLRYTGPVELPVLQVTSDIVALCSGDHRAMVETDDPAVREWAVSFVDSLRTDATRVSAAALAAERAMSEDGPIAE